MGEQADALLERLVGSLIGTAELMNVYLGERLDLYAPLAEGWLTSSDLAARAGIAERYAREWLEEQAVAAFIEVDDQSASAAARRYQLSAEHAQVLLDRDDLPRGVRADDGRRGTAAPRAHAGVPRRRRRRMGARRARHERGAGVRQPADVHQCPRRVV